MEQPDGNATDDLSPEEIQLLRDMIEGRSRMNWLYARLRFWASWFFGLTATLVAFRDDMRNLVLWFFGR